MVGRIEAPSEPLRTSLTLTPCMSIARLTMYSPRPLPLPLPLALAPVNSRGPGLALEEAGQQRGVDARAGIDDVEPRGQRRVGVGHVDGHGSRCIGPDANGFCLMRSRTHSPGHNRPPVIHSEFPELARRG